MIIIANYINNGKIYLMKIKYKENIAHNLSINYLIY